MHDSLKSRNAGNAFCDFRLKQRIPFIRVFICENFVFIYLSRPVENNKVGMNERCTNRLLGAAAVSHSECVMRAERLWEAARTGLGRSPPAGVCRLTDSTALVYHTAAAAAAMGRVC